MDEPARIGSRVQRMRNELGLTQRQLAEPSYTPAYISTLESGRVRPSETALRFLAGRLGTSYEELATGRPAHLATEVRLALADAQQTLATGAADEAAVRYRQLLDEAEELALVPEQAEALLGLGDCALESGSSRMRSATSRRPSACWPVNRCPAGPAPSAAAPSRTCSPESCATPATCWNPPSTSWARAGWPTRRRWSCSTPR